MTLTLTSNGSTMTSYTPAADTGREPATAAGGWLTPAPADRHPDGLEPRPGAAGTEAGS